MTTLFAAAFAEVLADETVMVGSVFFWLFILVVVLIILKACHVI